MDKKSEGFVLSILILQEWEGG